MTKIFDFSSKSNILFQKFFTIVDFSLKELCLRDELDNSITVATLSSLIEPKQRNEKHNMPSFDKVDKDDVEIYLYADQDKFFLKIVLIKKILIVCHRFNSEGWLCFVLPGNEVQQRRILQKTH